MLNVGGFGPCWIGARPGGPVTSASAARLGPVVYAVELGEIPPDPFPSVGRLGAVPHGDEWVARR